MLGLYADFQCQTGGNSWIRCIFEDGTIHGGAFYAGVFNDVKPIMHKEMCGEKLKYGTYMLCKITGDSTGRAGCIFISSTISDFHVSNYSLFANCVIRDSKVVSADQLKIHECILENCIIHGTECFDDRNTFTKCTFYPGKRTQMKVERNTINECEFHDIVFTSGLLDLDFNSITFIRCYVRIDKVDVPIRSGWYQRGERIFVREHTQAAVTQVALLCPSDVTVYCAR